jgi:hypothetical protein
MAPSAAGEGDVLAVFTKRLLPSSRVDVAAITVWDPADLGSEG